MKTFAIAICNGYRSALELHILQGESDLLVLQNFLIGFGYDELGLLAYDSIEEIIKFLDYDDIASLAMQEIFPQI